MVFLVSLKLRGVETGSDGEEGFRRVWSVFLCFFELTSRLKQMNKKLDTMLGQIVAEKRGKNWALTGFMRSAWDSIREQLDAHVQRDQP